MEGFTSDNLQSNEKLGNYELDSKVEREVGVKMNIVDKKVSLNKLKQTP